MSVIVEGWQLQAVTPDGALVADLPLVTNSGRHDWDLSRANPGGMRATIDAMRDLPDWRSVWLRGIYRCATGVHVLGTWIPQSAPTSYGRGRTVELAGVDVTGLLSRAVLRSSLSCPAGTPVAETVQGLIAAHAPALVASIGDTDETLRTALGWDVGTPVLTVANALLDAAGYTPVRPTRDGQVYSARWTPYAQRPDAIIFDRDRGDAVPYLPDVTADDALLERPDQVIARGAGSQDAPGIVAAWPEQTMPGAVTKIIDTEATDIAAATLAARRAWEEAQARSLTAPIVGPWRPVMPGDMATWRWERHGLAVRAEITSVSTEWRLSSPTTYRLSEVPT